MTLEHFSVTALFFTGMVYGTQKQCPLRGSNHCQKYTTLYERMHKQCFTYWLHCFAVINTTGYIWFQEWSISYDRNIFEATTNNLLPYGKWKSWGKMVRKIEKLQKLVEIRKVQISLVWLYVKYCLCVVFF